MKLAKWQQLTKLQLLFISWRHSDNKKAPQVDPLFLDFDFANIRGHDYDHRFLNVLSIKISIAGSSLPHSIINISILFQFLVI